MVESAAGLRAELVAAGLGAYADDLVALLRPSVRFELVEGVAEDAIPVGATKVGGRPDLPPGTPWPRTPDGLRQAFVAQVDLASVTAYDTERLLPPDGWLSFFVDAGPVDQPWGIFHREAGRWAVLHTPPAAALVRREFPDDLDADCRFGCCPVEAHPELNLPLDQAYDVERLGLTRDEQWAYGRVHEAHQHWGDARLLGNADAFQGDLQVTCQTVSRGIDDHWDVRELDVLEGAAEWRLLFQIDTHAEIGMSWALTGQLYYLMREADLRARRWDAAWLRLESS